MVSMEVSDRGKVSMAASSRELVSIEGSSRRPRRQETQGLRPSLHVGECSFCLTLKAQRGGGVSD